MTRSPWAQDICVPPLNFDLVWRLYYRSRCACVLDRSIRLYKRIAQLGVDVWCWYELGIQVAGARVPVMYQSWCGSCCLWTSGSDVERWFNLGEPRPILSDSPACLTSSGRGIIVTIIDEILSLFIDFFSHSYLFVYL